MNYQAIYDKLIKRGQTRVLYGTYIENHHIIPRSDGGRNKKTNKVELTPKEHHLCHLLLIKMRMCLKYCYRHLSLREYIEIKESEKHKIRNAFKKKEKEWIFKEEYANSYNYLEDIVNP